MNQTKKGSVAEVATNILIGYVVSFTANLLILPQFGFNVTIVQNIKIGLLFTVVSIIRSYCVRRLFNKFNFFGRGK